MSSPEIPVCPFGSKSLSASYPSQAQPLLLLFIVFLLVSLKFSDFYQQLQPINLLASKIAASPGETSPAAQLIFTLLFLLPVVSAIMMWRGI